MDSIQQRLVEEKKGLDRKIEKLVNFMHRQTYGNLEVVEQGLLMVQLAAMQTYSSTLGRRIELVEEFYE